MSYSFRSSWFSSCATVGSPARSGPSSLLRISIFTSSGFRAGSSAIMRRNACRIGSAGGIAPPRSLGFERTIKTLKGQPRVLLIGASTLGNKCMNDAMRVFNTSPSAFPVRPINSNGVSPRSVLSASSTLKTTVIGSPPCARSSAVLTRTSKSWSRNHLLRRTRTSSTNGGGASPNCNRRNSSSVTAVFRGDRENTLPA